MADGDWEFKCYQSLVDKVSQRENVDQVLMVGLGDVYDESRILEVVNRAKGKKVYSIFIELVQNIHHHSAAKSSMVDREGAGVVILSNDDQHYFITSGNMINTADAPGIVSRIGQLNALDREGLRTSYRAQMKLPVRKGAKGSGLGFIDIRRKTGLPLGVESEVISGTHSFLTIRAKIDKGSSHA
jgi:hypothetical protein